MSFILYRDLIKRVQPKEVLGFIKRLVNIGGSLWISSRAFSEPRLFKDEWGYRVQKASHLRVSGGEVGSQPVDPGYPVYPCFNDQLSWAY